MDVNRINPANWKYLRGRDRDVYRQLEWFRAAVDYRCNEDGARSGIALGLAVGCDVSQGFISLLRYGHRLPDFETATKIANHFGMTLVDFIEEGRELSEGYDVGGNLTQARSLTGKIMREGDYKTQEMILSLLQTAAQQVEAQRKAA